jgi:hypothetical protein
MVSEERKAKFRELYEEFSRDYLSEPRGQQHLQRYREVRIEGRNNLRDIREEFERAGKIPTDRVLRQLLPHTNSAAHRASGAWIHVAPAIQGEIKTWFERAGWTKHEDWPQVATAILDFVVRCTEDPSSLEAACNDFASSPYTTGLQTGMLTPILNAILPDTFTIINNKSRSVINDLAESSLRQRLTDYPRANAVARRVLIDLHDTMINPQALPPADVFDMYCHWLVAEKRESPLYGTEGAIRAPDGEVTVTVPENDDSVVALGGGIIAQSRESHRIQACLGEIGAKMKFQVWIPRADRARVLECSPNLGSALLDTLPLNYIDVTLKTIEQIDVIWIKRQSIVRAFEVEHTTAVYSGLLRMADLLSLQPDINIRLHIVAPDEKQEKVMREIRRPTFRNLEKGPLQQRCSFISYSSVLGLQQIQHLEYMTDDVLKKYEEFAEQE